MDGRYVFSGILALVLITLAMQLASADLSCSVATSCGGDQRILGLENDTGGSKNAHVQNATFTSYNYSICCSSTGQTISTSCGGSKATEFIRLQNSTGGTTNAHVQDASAGGLPVTYSHSACIAGDGTSSCVFYGGSCPSGYTCLGSIASSEGNDYTNAHMGNCTAYSLKVCCTMNSLPTQGTPVLNATDHPANTTTANLTAYNQSTGDPDGNTVYNTYDWRLNGTSIAILNMPFNHNVTSTTADAVTDYSTFANAGTLGGGTGSRVPSWNTTCIYGGCYTFDGQDDSVEIAADQSHNFSGSFTIAAWAYLHTDSASGRKIVAKYYGGGSSQTDYRLQIYPTRAQFDVANTSGDVIQARGNEVALNTWEHLVGVFNTSHVLIYQNGTLTDTTPFNGVQRNRNEPLLIGNSGQSGGGTGTDNTRNFDGNIDEVLIINQSLSAEQINQLYLEGASALENRVLVSQETTFGDNWTVCLTPTDTMDDGTTTCSNTLTVQGNEAPSVPTLLEPTNNNNSVLERYPVFDWTDSTDPDDNLDYYTINISAPATCAAIPLRNITPSTYTSIEELCVDETYNWTVRACDTEGACSAWASQFNFTIASTVDISLTTNSTNFGSLFASTASQTNANDTLDSDPGPLVATNNGNVLTSLDIKALDALWDNQPLNTTYLQYAEENSSNWLNVTINYTDVYETLDYGNTVELEINITVPIAEPPGAKSSTVQVLGVSEE